MIESTPFYISGYDSMSWYVRLVQLVYYSTDTVLVTVRCVQATAQLVGTIPSKIGEKMYCHSHHSLPLYTTCVQVLG